MKSLLMRNFKLRQWTLYIYLGLLVFFPIYIIITVNTDFGFIIFIPIGIILMIISIFDAGHMFRVHKRLGGQQAYIYFASLPVSKKDMLRANYLTCLLLTLFGALVIGLYDSQTIDNELMNRLHISTAYSFLIVNFLSIPIAFPKYTEYKRKGVSYVGYLIFMLIVIPVMYSFFFTVLNHAMFNNQLSKNEVAYFLNNGLLVIAILIFIINYFIQLKYIKRL
ncbi:MULTISPECIES: phenol-soluble modulin export ABC transporter permease subunit PmtB [Staphylococcus]|uniref:ABC-2 transporter permease n=1 Tax=Staphylococcus lugdunensis TaxID=28035 RepID=A0ABX6BUQ0_STALU|nr:MULTISPECIES: ABC-2 transporter permease [Staphylococcus]ADC87129.1 hypothetical protein SLGD_00997 [Staphylococcus lugdunensis HKU09-01]ARB77396.1 hypothetical protein A6J61_03360 [Staphylococcus lugdunensis]ARJ08909.1 hypothetical protein B7454_05730 [Staphylococcus lugdunensis]ARJ15947.1 hypothetical protein B6N54_04770 [Staphylococcus lugdunensis]ARJ18509.1 hypothetical protein B7467_05645 [Staphylococcus lugdunensis]